MTDLQTYTGPCVYVLYVYVYTFVYYLAVDSYILMQPVRGLMVIVAQQILNN